MKAVNGAVTVPVATVSDGKAHFYRFDDGGKEISFFVVKGSDVLFTLLLMPAMYVSVRRKDTLSRTTPWCVRTAIRSLP